MGGGARDKAHLRAMLLHARASLRPDQLDEAALVLARVVADISASRPGPVAAYVSFGSEPPTGPLRAALRDTTVLLPAVRPDGDLDWVRDGEHGGDSSRFAADSGGVAVASSGFAADSGRVAADSSGFGADSSGFAADSSRVAADCSRVAADSGGDGLGLVRHRGDGRHPGGRVLGPGALAGCALVVVPALAVDRSGTRLGRGGGSYDRALTHVPAGVPVLAVLHDGELLDELPLEGHDRPVSAVVLPSRGLVEVGRGQAC